MRWTIGWQGTRLGGAAILSLCLSIAACAGAPSTPAPVVSTIPLAPSPTATATASSTPTVSHPASPSPASSAAPSTAPPAPSTSPTSSAGPATADLRGTGDGSLDGPITVTSISCQLPATDGLQIFLLGTFGEQGPALNMHLSTGLISLFVATGSGAQFRSRSFSGTGLTSFDPAVGAVIDSPLEEVTPPSTDPTGIGVLRSISGRVDCGNQQAGTSSLVLVGTTPDGRIDGQLDPVRVGCNVSKEHGQSVQTFGIGKLGTRSVTAIVNVTGEGFTVFLSGSGIPAYFYTSTDPASASLIETGARIEGEASTAGAAGDAPLTIRVSGSVVCGTTVSGP